MGSTEYIYQQQLKKGFSPLRSSDVAEASGEFANSTINHLEATNSQGLPVDHIYMDLPGVIIIGTRSNACTIWIDPYAPMIPTQPTYYYTKP